MGRRTQQAYRGALSNHPTLAQILDFFTIVNILEVSRFVHLGPYEMFCPLALARSTINKGEPSSFAHHHTTHTQPPAHTYKLSSTLTKALL